MEARACSAPKLHYNGEPRPLPQAAGQKLQGQPARLPAWVGPVRRWRAWDWRWLASDHGEVCGRGDALKGHSAI